MKPEDTLAGNKADIQFGEMINKYWLWIIALIYFVITVLLYSLIKTSPLREYLILSGAIFIILVAMFKMIK